jgi:hypothetical protein
MGGAEAGGGGLKTTTTKTRRAARSLDAMVQIVRHSRPVWVHVTYSDPFDGTMLCRSSMPYERRRAADGFYSRGVRVMKEGLKTICSKTLQGRTPSVSVKLC